MSQSNIHVARVTTIFIRWNIASKMLIAFLMILATNLDILYQVTRTQNKSHIIYILSINM